MHDGNNQHAHCALPEIQDLLTLQRAVLLINLSSPGRFGLVVTGGCLA